MKKHQLLVLGVMALLIQGCGGGEDEKTVEIAEFQSSSAKRALAGDWPQMNYTAFNQTQWEAAWAERRATLNCSRPVNADACAQLGPPDAPFTTSIVIGVTLSKGLAFPANATPKASMEGDVLTIETPWELMSTSAPEGSPPATKFWVIRAKPSKVVTKPAGAT